jgi:iron complex outermembrane receptor protein
LWKLNPKLQVRVSASNLLHREYETGSGFVSDEVDQTATTAAQTYTTWTAKLEYRF